MNITEHPTRDSCGRRGGCNPPPRGFTLLEILIGLALLGLLVGGIFSVQRGAMQVSAEITTQETRTLRVHSFCELLRRTFEQMPGNARVNLQGYGGGGSDLSEVAFTDYPLAFTWGQSTAGAKTVIFRTERSGALGIQASLIYLNEEASQAYLQGKFDEAFIMGRITIMDGLLHLAWRFYDDQRQEWVEEWLPTNTRRPSFIEMTMQPIDGYDPVRLIFWIPTMANPQQFTSGFANQPAVPTVPGQPGTVPGQPGAGGPGGRGDGFDGRGGRGRGDGGRGRGDGGRGGGGRDGGRGGGGGDGFRGGGPGGGSRPR